MADMAFTLDDILWICGAFGAVYGVYKLWKAYILKRTHQDEAIERLDKELAETSKTNAMILRTLLALVNHNIDGNGIDGMKAVRKELENFIVK